MNNTLNKNEIIDPMIEIKSVYLKGDEIKYDVEWQYTSEPSKYISQTEKGIIFDKKYPTRCERYNGKPYTKIKINGNWGEMKPNTIYPEYINEELVGDLSTKLVINASNDSKQNQILDSNTKTTTKLAINSHSDSTPNDKQKTGTVTTNNLSVNDLKDIKPKEIETDKVIKTVISCPSNNNNNDNPLIDSLGVDINIDVSTVDADCPTNNMEIYHAYSTSLYINEGIKSKTYKMQILKKINQPEYYFYSKLEEFYDNVPVSNLLIPSITFELDTKKAVRQRFKDDFAKKTGNRWMNRCKFKVQPDRWLLGCSVYIYNTDVESRNIRKNLKRTLSLCHKLAMDEVQRFLPSVNKIQIKALLEFFEWETSKIIPWIKKMKNDYHYQQRLIYNMNHNNGRYSEQETKDLDLNALIADYLASAVTRNRSIEQNNDMDIDEMPDDKNKNNRNKRRKRKFNSVENQNKANMVPKKKQRLK